MSISIIKADYANPTHQKAIVKILDHYAQDPMGGGEGLSDYTKNNLIDSLKKNHSAISLLAFEGEKPVGLLNAFEGFSTFACKPLINIHDIAVLESYRGKGIGRLLIEGIEKIAVEKDCCKLTLEVLSNNKPAKGLYESLGFNDYQLNPEAGTALFWQKKL